ncbi:LOW QUALITY PROTEIN: GRIP1-associated protein 1 [Aegotheles albertisi]
MAQALSAEEFQRMQAQLLELRTENYRLSDELRKNGAELSGLRQRVQALDKDLAKANKALSKSKKAQEVEALLGETRMLQGKLQSQEDDFRLQNSTLLRELGKLCAQIEGLEEENRQLRGAQGGLRERTGALVQELQEAQGQREALGTQLRACAGDRDTLRQRLEEAQEQLEQLQREHESTQRHRDELEVTGGRVQELGVALGDAERQRELQEAEGRALRQELKDVRDGQRILEKKGSATLKDLKRQLQLERRRADRLQERLQELLTPTRTRSGLEELGLEGGSPGRGPGGDSSSLSSLGRDGSAPGSTKSGSCSRGGSGAGGVPGGGGLSPAEVAELFQRLAQSQQERWLLEEKVRHLEVSSASMAEDLCRKSAIIQSFVRDSRLEAAGPPGPPRRGAGPGEEGLWEMNKKLQNMLEEQLTKNLHLGQDLEALTQELARLSKEREAPPGPP